MDSLIKILDSFPDEGFVKVDGFDAAIVGISNKSCLVYSIDKIIKILMSRNNWTYKEAFDYFYYNIEDSHSDKKIIFVNLIK
jgi:hypothetical protein